MSDMEMKTAAPSTENQKKTDSGLTNGLSVVTADAMRFIPPAATSSPQSKVAPASIPVPVPYRGLHVFNYSVTFQFHSNVTGA